MVNQDLLKILRCPACVHEKGKEGHLTLEQKAWLVCADCARKYPIKETIPVLLIEEGDKWKDTAPADLPNPPPPA